MTGFPRRKGVDMSTAGSTRGPHGDSSVTVIERGRAITAGSSSPLAEVLDDAQYDEGDGPCLHAARETEIIRVDDTGRLTHV
jgi:hypothetical protein